MIKIILFDVDQVLVNASGKYFSLHLQEDFGISTEITRDFFLTEHQDCIIGKKDLKEVLPKYMKKWGWKGTIDELLSYWFKSEHIVNDDLVKEIDAYKEKDLKIYLATNQDTHRMKYILNEMGLGKFIDGAFVSSQIGYKKPQPEYFSTVLSKLNLYKPNEILFWDDNLENVEAARVFEINAEQYTNFPMYKNIMKEKYNI